MLEAVPLQPLSLNPVIEVKEKLSLHLMKHHTMKTYRGVDQVEVSSQFNTQTLNSREKDPGVRRGGYRAGVDAVTNRKT
jgi:hypothetical protein